jgi:hypothetical protein
MAIDSFIDVAGGFARFKRRLPGRQGIAEREHAL